MYGLKKEVIDDICGVFTRFPQLEEAILYVSRAKGSFRPGSDIDLAFKGENLNLALLNTLSLELDNLLLPYSFDLSIYEQISNPDLLEHIDRVGKVIFRGS